MNASEEDLKPRRGYLRRLPPEIESLRDRIVDRFTGQPLSEISAFVQKVLASEKNEVNRIAALAARVVLIRDHVNEVIRLNNPSFLKPTPEAAITDDSAEAPAEHVVMVANEDAVLQDGMRRVKIIEDSTVHDVLFPAGITVDVKEADAERLTSSGKAEYIEVTASETTETQTSEVIDHEDAAATPDAEPDADPASGAPEAATESNENSEDTEDASAEPNSTEEADDEEASAEETSAADEDNQKGD
jgi:hypothetical protein